MRDHASATAVAPAPAPPDINGRIAARVRGLRAGLGWSLDKLAGRCGVSRSMISLVERGESSPTAVVLEKIASGLGVPLASLFDEPRADAEPVSRAADRTTWRDPQSGYERTQISPPGFSSAMRIVEVMLPAGAHVAYETATRETGIDQQIWVRSGRIEVAHGDETQRLAEGDCLAMRLTAPTAFRNRTRQAARYVVVVASEAARVAR
jgi:transcriptional regulator with XRE-family HTH domain